MEPVVNAVVCRWHARVGPGGEDRSELREDQRARPGDAPVLVVPSRHQQGRDGQRLRHRARHRIPDIREGGHRVHRAGRPRAWDDRVAADGLEPSRVQLPDAYDRECARVHGQRREGSEGVGTTNKTHLADYERALSDATGAILRVHHSNYRIVGFAEEPPIEDLAALGRARGVPVIDDLGSGALVDLARFGLAAEPLVTASVRAGADVVCFSGDKLIGGPQSGIIAGKSDWIHKIRKNPLARAFRCGKLTLAALEATLKLFLAPDKLVERHPIYRMLALTPDELARRAKKMAASLRKALPASAAVEVEDGASQVGSGAVPVETLPTKVVAVRSTALPPEELARRLRFSTPPVFARIHKDAVLFDLRTIQPGEDALVERAIAEILT